jgi:hypothetical protein
LSKRWKKKEHNWVGGWEFHTIQWDWDEQVTKIILIEQEVTGEATGRSICRGHALIVFFTSRACLGANYHIFSSPFSFRLPQRREA